MQKRQEGGSQAAEYADHKTDRVLILKAELGNQQPGAQAGDQQAGQIDRCHLAPTRQPAEHNQVQPVRRKADRPNRGAANFDAQEEQQPVDSEGEPDHQQGTRGPPVPLLEAGSCS